MQPDLHSRTLAAHTLHQFRTLSPLTHCMTNEVVQSFTANTLLALGASPAMVIEPEEASQFAAIASALLINVGTLTQERATAMRAAVERAQLAKTPWTLDPLPWGRWSFVVASVWICWRYSLQLSAATLRKYWLWRV